MAERSSFYLAHPFNCRHRVRDELQVPLQEMGIKVANPFYAADFAPRQDVAEIEAGLIDKYDVKRRNAQSIVTADLDAIRDAHIILAYLPETGIGTPMEIFYASHVLNMATWVITDKFAGHPWIKVYADAVWPSIRGFVDFMKRGTSGAIIAKLTEESIARSLRRLGI